MSFTKDERSVFQFVSKDLCKKLKSDFLALHNNNTFFEYMVKTKFIRCKNLRNYLMLSFIENELLKHKDFAVHQCCYKASIEFEISKKQAYNIYLDYKKCKNIIEECKYIKQFKNLFKSEDVDFLLKNKLLRVVDVRNYLYIKQIYEMDQEVISKGNYVEKSVFIESVSSDYDISKRQGFNVYNKFYFNFYLFE